MWFKHRIQYETGQDIDVQLTGPVRLNMPEQPNGYECGPRVLQAFQYLVQQPDVDPRENTALQTSSHNCDKDIHDQIAALLLRLYVSICTPLLEPARPTVVVHSFQEQPQRGGQVDGGVGTCTVTAPIIT